MTAVLRLVDSGDAGGHDGCVPPLEAWEIYMRGAGRSERTTKDGVATMRQLERFAGKHAEDMTAIDVSRFLGRSEIGASSRCAYFGHIHAFYNWFAGEGGNHVTRRIPRPKAPKYSPRPVTTDKLRRLLDTRMHRRTYVMILLAALAGLRVHEIAKLRGEDVDIEARTVRVHGKGGRIDVLPLHPLLAAAALTMPERGWWFPANNRRPGEHVHGKGVSDIIGNAMRRANVAGTPHSLRHWYGTSLVEFGADLRTAQTLLRHANLQTTAMYVAVTDRSRVEAVDRLNPRGRYAIGIGS